MEVGAKLGDWEIQKLIGSGAFGSVYLLKKLKSDEKIAVKVCHWKMEEMLPKFVMKWIMEVEAMSNFNNRTIVKVRKSINLTPWMQNTGVVKLPILCMEYCDGGNLRDFLNRPENVNGLPEQEVRCMLFDVKNAIYHLHCLNKIHRNLKPECIVLKSVEDPSFNRTYVYKLTNLGCLKDFESDSDTVCSNFTGSLQYLAPELFYSKTHSLSADYWSFGLIAFEAVCGIRPFLPNMSPVQWMPSIKNKTSDQICAYLNISDEITFSNEIYAENKISACLKAQLEVWLTKMLEWDPAKRGFSPKMFQVLNDLDVLLNKKIIIIFSVSTYQYLSYAVDERTLFATLQGWVFNDTQININDQVFVSSVDKCDVELESFAIKYWSDQVKVMLYLYRKDKLMDNNKPKISPNIKLNLENPKMNLNYFHFMRVISYIHFFIYNEQDLYETFKEAIVLRLDSVKEAIDKLQSTRLDSENHLRRLESKNALLNEIIASELANIDKNDNQDKTEYINEVKEWISKGNALNSDILLLKEARKQLGTRLDSIIRRTDQICPKPNDDDMSELLKSVQNHVSTAANIPINDRKEQKSCYNVVKLLYKSLKIRDKLMFNADNLKVAQIIADVHLESQMIKDLFASIYNNADSLSNSVNTLIIDKQEIPWKMMKKEKSNESMNFKSLTNFKIGEPMRSPVPVVPDRDSLELRSLIDDNVRLRRDAQNFIESIIHEEHKEDSIDDEGSI